MQQGNGDLIGSSSTALKTWNATRPLRFNRLQHRVPSPRPLFKCVLIDDVEFTRRVSQQSSEDEALLGRAFVRLAQSVQNGRRYRTVHVLALAAGRANQRNIWGGVWLITLGVLSI